MNLLLDTHVALWAVTADTRLSGAARMLIGDPRNIAFISVASIWEIAIKHARNRGLADDMPISGSQARDIFRHAGYKLLRIEADHAAAVDSLPRLHGDPFDRLIVAQAAVESMRLLTKNRDVARYDGDIMLI